MAVMMVVAVVASAAPVSVDRAKTVAQSFLKSQGISLQLTDITSTTPFTEFYVFAGQGGEGFILVSADDCVVPILGYSATSFFTAENMPENVRGWLEDYEGAIRFYKNHQSPLRTSDGRFDEVADQWRQLAEGGYMPALNTTVSPLLLTYWNQSPYYNNLCPYDSYEGENAVTGCVATATAQIMKYHNWPTTGYGSHSYTHSDYDTLSANFGNTTYAWPSMPNVLTSSSTPAQINAVATLMYHVGVAVEMDYSVSGSGANNYSINNEASSEYALQYYFKYSSDIRSVFRDAYSDNAWSALLRAELDASRPILYSGRSSDGGHSFVCDGYDNNGQFHFNWGWGGYCDGYFTMGSLNPSVGGIGGNSSGTYNVQNVATIGIHPNDDWSSTASTTVTATASNATYGDVIGSGTYTFGTEYTLLATAAPNCRFVHWDDNNAYNPRTITATGGSRSYTAIFEPLSGDTLGYTSGSVTGICFGTGNDSDDKYWGIKLPSAVLTAGSSLTAVQMYVKYAGSYDVQVRLGSTSNQVVNQNVVFTEADEGFWRTVTLASPVAVTGTQDIYLVLHNNTIAYPAPLATGCGNGNGFLWGSSLSSYYSYYPQYSVAIRGIFNGGSPVDPPVTGDTISYCQNNAYATSIGAGGSLTWGVRFPASAVSSHNYLTDVMIHISYPGTYTLNVYQNATGAGTAAYTQAVAMSDTGWNTIHMANPVVLTGSTQPLWITFSNSGVDYPADGVAGLSDTNGKLVNLGEWMSLTTFSMDYTWMIKGILSNTMPAPTVAISGPANFHTGTSVTFTAVGPTGATYSWQLNGATPSTATGATASAVWNVGGTFNVICTATTSTGIAHDTLQVTVIDCGGGISTFPYTMGFEAGESLECWNFYDVDGDGYNWDPTFLAGQNYGHNDSPNLIASASYASGVGALTPDNWMVTPRLNFVSGHTYTLTWYDRAQDPNYPAEHYAVYVSTTGNAPSNFDTNAPLQQYTLSSSNYTQRTIDLSSYAGQNVWIAFRHYNCSDMFWLELDDISVIDSTIAPPPTSSITVVVSVNDSTMGTTNPAPNSYVFTEGQSTTFTAISYPGYHFVEWEASYLGMSTSTTINPLGFGYLPLPNGTIVTLTAIFAPDTTADCDGISTFPYTMGFETGESLDCWSFYDADADGYTWDPTFLAGDFYGHNGSPNVIASASYINDVGALTPDNWMVTPRLDFESGHPYTLTWYDRALDANYPAEHYAVYLSTTGNAPSNFDTNAPLQQYTLSSANYTQRTIDLSSYAGQSVWIAFRHYNCSDKYWLVLDDITVVDSTVTPPPASSAYVNIAVNNAAYGTTNPAPGTHTYFVGDTVIVQAIASSGNHFVNWNLDGGITTTNPVAFIIPDSYAGQTISLTANFASDLPPVFEGDTISYCQDDAFASSIGAGGELTWGIRFPAVSLAGRDYLTDVMIHISYAGTYTLNVYQNATGSGTAAYTQAVAMTTIGWNTIHLATPVALAGSTQPLWITFSNNDVTYPADAVVGLLDTNSSLVYLGDWMSLITASEGSLDYSWMIKGITSSSLVADSTTIILSINDPAMGITTPAPGTYTYAVGDMVTAQAVANSGYHFVGWNAMGMVIPTNPLMLPIPAAAAGLTIPVTAVFAPDSVGPQTDSVTIILSVNDSAMGYTIPAAGTYTFAVGQMVTAQAFANEGYHFEGWSAMGTTLPINPLMLPIPAEAAGLTIPVTAVFAPNSVGPQTDSVTFTLAVNDSTMGTIDPAPGVHTIAVGDEITLTATPFAGYHFVAWEASVMGETERTDENPVEIGFDDPIPEGIDIVLTAIFAPDSTQGISTVSSAQCSVYPNPADDAATISVTGVNGKVNIAVVDMNGRTVASETMECAADCVKTLNVANLAQGAYFVRITGENVNMVKKLVVR